MRFAALTIILTSSHLTICEIHDYCEKENCNIDASLNAYEQDDPRLIEALRSRFLRPPSPKENPYDWKNPKCEVDKSTGLPKLGAQIGVPYVVDKGIYKGLKRDGFFIEAGAYDGCTISNSLLFEMTRNWTGLLVEPNTGLFGKLSRVNRKAWSLPHCFSTTTRPEIVKFDVAGAHSGITIDGKPKPGDGVAENDPERRIEKVQCFPVYSLLLALGNPVVDYFSLDIEGAEFPVLKSIPWDKVKINVLGIEMPRLGVIFPGDEDDLRTFLAEKGFVFYQRVAFDEIFIQKDLLKLD